jgi:hypothetical protein
MFLFMSLRAYTETPRRIIKIKRIIDEALTAPSQEATTLTAIGLSGRASASELFIPVAKIRLTGVRPYVFAHFLGYTLIPVDLLP